MAWLETHQGVWSHRKTLDLASRLGLSETYTVAHLIRLWHLALDNATPDGDVTSLLPERVSNILTRAADFHGDADTFYKSLREAGWVEDSPLFPNAIRFHNFYDYAGKYLERKSEKRAMMRRLRRAILSDGNVAEQDGNVTNNRGNVSPLQESTSTTVPTVPTVPSRASRSNLKPHLTDEEISQLHAEYDAAITAGRVTQEIAAALDHEAAYKRGKSGSWKLYVQTWLRRAASPPALFRSQSPGANGTGGRTSRVDKLPERSEYGKADRSW